MNDRLVRNNGWLDANSIIASRLFPLHVMPCFFFDGEQAQARVEAAGGRAMSDAIRALYGMSLVEELDEGLSSYLITQRSSLKRDVGDVQQTELDKKRSQHAQLEGELSSLRRRRDELMQQIADAATEKEARLFELQSLGMKR